jgi:DNA-binding transcriptional ArsR family regulator
MRIIECCDNPEAVSPRQAVPVANLRAELEELTAGMCRALNDPKRLMMLYALAGRPRSVGELVETLGLSQSNVSQHLAVLRDRGLVESTRDANRVIYTLRDPRVVDAIDLLREVMSDELVRRQALRGRSGQSARP